MSTSTTKNRVGIVSIIAGGLAGVALTFGAASIATDNLWRQIGQTITPVNSSYDVKLGSNGTPLATLITGTCDLTGMDASHTATTSKAYDCAVTGVQTGDIVFVGQATTTPTTNYGWRILGANASSTAGFITVHVMNLTGGNATPSASAVGSSTPYLILRDGS